MNSFPIDDVRAEFPALSITDSGVPRVYVDNPAGTQVPRRVADATARCLLETNANLGGYFKTSIAAEEVVVNAHHAMARFLGASSEREVVIGPSMTTLTFHLSRSIGRMLKPGDEIVVTRMDHEGNVSPWLMLAEDLGLTVRWVPFDEQTWVIEPQALEAALSSKTRLVALNYASNLTGSVNDVRTLIDRIHAAGALAYVDAVQFAPHGRIDVQALNCDFLAVSSYKFFGPHLGIVWGRESLLQQLDAYKVRPQTSDLPYKFETGTPQIEQLAALSACVEYCENVMSIGSEAMSAAEVLGAGDEVTSAGNEVLGAGREVMSAGNEVLGAGGEMMGAGSVIGAGREVLSTGSEVLRARPSDVMLRYRSAAEPVEAYERRLTTHLIDGLQQIGGVRIIGITDPARYDRRVPTVSFVHGRRTPSEIASELARRNIFVWSGHNFALEVVRQLGIDEEQGVVRIGLAHYNTLAEVEKTVEAVAAICSAG